MKDLIKDLRSAIIDTESHTYSGTINKKEVNHALKKLRVLEKSLILSNKH